MSVKKRNGNWFIRFTYNGKAFSQSAGKGASKQEALDMEQHMLKELRCVENGLIPDKTIEDALHRWLEEFVLIDGGLEGKNIILSHVRNILHYIEGRPLTDISKVAYEMATDMQSKGFAASTIRKRLYPMKRAAKLSYKHWDWLAEPLHFKFPEIKGTNKRDTFLTVAEVDRLALACRDEMAKDMIYFMAYTGIRCAEMWRLDENSLHDDVLLIDGKGHLKRAIPLDQKQVDFVEKYIPLTKGYWYLTYYFKYAREAINMPHIRPHDLRHTYGTMLAEAGVPLRTIMELMGHQTTEQAQVYTRLSVDHLRNHIPRQVEPTINKVSIMKQNQQGEGALIMRPKLQVVR